MTIFKCKMCGGDLTIIENRTVCECQYCGSKQTISAIDDEKIIKLYERANRLRFSNEFDKAATVYESIIEKKDTEAEAYWGMLLCKYGIEYVDDPATDAKIPTCHRLSFDSFMDDEDFEFVMENADSDSKNVYREQAKQIEEVRKGIIEVSGKEKPYDIFICYKETDTDGNRTLDSVIAQDVYDTLTEKGYRVFFSRISLEDKLGIEYEPYIFAALNSAKIMLAFGTSYDNYNAVWVKNEWSRYLKIIARDKNKYLIPCYKDIDAYDMPKEFAKLQAQDMGKVGAMQDLLRGIDKIIDSKSEEKITISKKDGNNNKKNSLSRQKKIKVVRKFLLFMAIMVIICGGVYAGVSGIKVLLEKRNGTNHIGEAITIGRYEGQGENADIHDLRWVIVDAKDGKYLAVSEDVIFASIYAEENGVKWSESTIRAILNDDFFEQSFTEEEKNHINLTKISTVVSSEWGSNDKKEEVTEDYIFLLSESEFKSLIQDSNLSQIAALNAHYEIGQARSVWLRDFDMTIRNEKVEMKNKAYNEDGISVKQAYITEGIRPAMWVDSIDGIITTNSQNINEEVQILMEQNEFFEAYNILKGNGRCKTENFYECCYRLGEEELSNGNYKKAIEYLDLCGYDYSNKAQADGLLKEAYYNYINRVKRSSMEYDSRICKEAILTLVDDMKYDLSGVDLKLGFEPYMAFETGEYGIGRSNANSAKVGEPLIFYATTDERFNVVESKMILIIRYPDGKVDYINDVSTKWANGISTPGILKIDVTIDNEIIGTKTITITN